MGKAIKCDRCGVCFDPENTKGEFCRFRNPVFQDWADYRMNKRTYLMFSDENPDEIVDLCPDCGQMFRVFMDGHNPMGHDVEYFVNGYTVTNPATGKTEFHYFQQDEKSAENVEEKKPEKFRFSTRTEDPFSSENLNRYVTRLHNILKENANKKEDK